jgi:hypothetical protein
MDFIGHIYKVTYKVLGPADVADARLPVREENVSVDYGRPYGDIPVVLGVRWGVDQARIHILTTERVGPDPEFIAKSLCVTVGDLAEEYHEVCIGLEVNPGVDDFTAWLYRRYIKHMQAMNATILG